MIPTAKEALRQSWLASKPNHQFWWYWCIGPTDPRALNTFIERPAIQARLLYWLTSLHAVNGMLYYDVAVWSTQCPSKRPCKPVARINNTALTDFAPETFPDPSPGSTNGDVSIHEADPTITRTAEAFMRVDCCCRVHSRTRARVASRLAPSGSRTSLTASRQLHKQSVHNLIFRVNP